MQNVRTFDEVMAMQNELLETKEVRDLIAARGPYAALWPYGPTAQQLRDAIYPNWADAVERMVREARHRSMLATETPSSGGTT